MCCAIAALTFEAPLPAMAAMAAIGATITYDTVDAVEVLTDQIRVTGIISGQDAPQHEAVRDLGFAPFQPDHRAHRCSGFALRSARVACDVQTWEIPVRTDT
jgi:hypothetical protein